MSTYVQENRRHRSLLRKAAVLLRPAVIGCMVISSEPALADALETAYVNAMVPYVVLKRGTVECGKPAGEHIAYKTRMIGILGRIPNLDLIAADREIERAFERDAPRSANPICSDALLERYQYTFKTSAEIALKHLAEIVRERLRTN